MMRRISIAVFSAGWIGPLWLSAETLRQYLEVDLIPRWHGHTPPLNSFPFVHFSRQTFTLSCLWLAMVVFHWAWRWSRNPATHP